MPGENIQDWSATAANNATADSSINWAEGMPRASVNDSARSMMAAHAKHRNLSNGSITTGGTANAQTFSSGLSYTTVPTGLRVLLKIGASLTNTDTMTLNMDAIGAVTVKTQVATDLGGGEVKAGTYREFLYDGTNWILIEFGPKTLLDVQTASSSATLDFTTGITSKFDEYEFHIQGLVPATASTALYMRISQDTGATFKAGASDYRYAFNVTVDDATNNPFGSLGTTQIALTGAAISNSSGRSLSGRVRLTKPAQSSYLKNISWGLETFTAVGYINSNGAGAYVTDANTIDAVRFLVSSGNIASGSIKLYGL